MTESLSYAMERFREIYKPFLVEGARFMRPFDIPECPCTATKPPTNLIYYARIDDSDKRYCGFVHFYMDDYKFESVWNDPRKALSKLKRCDGIITPDFSTYREMPMALKIYNTYRMRALGYWLGTQGVKVINNVRWATAQSFKFSFLGVPKNSIVSVSTVGCLGSKVDDEFFAEGLEVMVERLSPSHILVYSFEKWRYLFDKYTERGIPVTFYDPPATNILVEKKTEKIYL